MTGLIPTSIKDFRQKNPLTQTINVRVNIFHGRFGAERGSLSVRLETFLTRLYLRRVSAAVDALPGGVHIEVFVDRLGTAWRSLAPAAESVDDLN
jgi:hypothetical protein